MGARYDITDLAELTGLSVRTIRYYLQERLLPPTGTPGPGAKYGDEHLERLRLVTRLQREHVSLAEIRRRLEAGETAMPEPPASDPGAAALDYLRALQQPPPAPAPPAPAPRPLRSSNMWERIALADGVELLVRRPVNRFDQRRIDRLVAEANRIFQEGS